MKIAAVTVLYNPTKETFQNIKGYIDEVEKVYAVDNSYDDHSEYVFSEKIEYLPNCDNLGIAAALNRGAEKAYADGYDWLLTMDQDSRFENGVVTKMADFINEVKNGNPPEEFPVTYEKLGLVSPLHIIRSHFNEEAEGIDSPAVVMTSGNLISLNAYKDIGGFKDWYFIDAVDFDYCLNLRDHGYEILRLKYLTLAHELGDGITKSFLGRKVTSFNHSPVRRYYIVRNRHYLYDEYKDKAVDFCNAEIRQTKKEAIKIILCEKDKINKLRHMYKGYRDYKKGIKGRFGGLKK